MTMDQQFEQQQIVLSIIVGHYRKWFYIFSDYKHKWVEELSNWIKM